MPTIEQTSEKGANLRLAFRVLGRHELLNQTLPRQVIEVRELGEAVLLQVFRQLFVVGDQAATNGLEGRGLNRASPITSTGYDPR